MTRGERTNAGKFKIEANKKHVEMRNQAMSVIGMLNKMLGKYDDSDDRD